jgi:hypothetical protein
MKLLLLFTLIALQAVPSAPAQQGVVTGQVRAVDGSPASQLRIGVQAVDATTEFAALAETDAAGRYRLEGIPPGRYYVTAGLVTSPTYYPGVSNVSEARVVTVTSGSTATGIDFSLVLPAFVRIRGRLSNMPAGIPAGLLTMSLLSPGALTTTATEAPVQSDGSFEFSKVAAGTYNIRMSRVTRLGTDVGRVQADKDISNLEIPAPQMLAGRVVVDDGTALPVVMSSPIPGGILFGSIRVRSSEGRGILESTNARLDGAFAALWLGPTSRMDLANVPIGYFVKSLMQGSTDLLTSPAVTPAQDVVLTLTRTPPAGVRTVRVTGRVLGLESYPTTNSRWLQFQSQTGSVPSVGETLLRADGTFEMDNVIPATYTVLVAPFLQGTVRPPPLVVPANGLQNAEIRFTSRPAQ